MVSEFEVNQHSMFQASEVYIQMLLQTNPYKPQTKNIAPPSPKNKTTVRLYGRNYRNLSALFLSANNPIVQLGAESRRSFLD